MPNNLFQLFQCCVSLPRHRTAESFWRAWFISCHWASINPALTTSDDCSPALNTTVTLLLILQNSGYVCINYLFESFHNLSRQPTALSLFNNFRDLIPSVKRVNWSFTKIKQDNTVKYLPQYTQHTQVSVLILFSRYSLHSPFLTSS